MPDAESYIRAAEAERARIIRATMKARTDSELAEILANPNAEFLVRGAAGDEQRDRLHELAANDPEWLQREENWARALDGLATSALRDMLRHAESMLADPPPAWTSYQHGAGRVWRERLAVELAARESEEVNA